MKRLLTCAAVAVGAVALLASPARAGGWAATTLDAVPAPKAGERIDVGFTIRQHGRTPVALDDVSITTTSAAGKATVWPARKEGAVGHYVAAVTFPEAGTVTWKVTQGWFGDQDLGAVDVVDPKAAPAPTPATPPSAPDPVPVTVVRHEPVALPLAVRLLLPAVAVGCGCLAVFEVVAGRRRRRQELVTA
jgi:hypothetical protein